MVNIVNFHSNFQFQWNLYTKLFFTSALKTFVKQKCVCVTGGNKLIDLVFLFDNFSISTCATNLDNS